MKVQSFLGAVDTRYPSRKEWVQTGTDETVFRLEIKGERGDRRRIERLARRIRRLVRKEKNL